MGQWMVRYMSEKYLNYSLNALIWIQLPVGDMLLQVVVKVMSGLFKMDLKYSPMVTYIFVRQHIIALLKRLAVIKNHFILLR